MQTTISDPRIAKHVSDLLLDVNRQLIESLSTVQNGCPENEYVEYRRKIGRLINVIFENFLEPIYIRHPELKPPELEL